MYTLLIVVVNKFFCVQLHFRVSCIKLNFSVSDTDLTTIAKLPQMCLSQLTPIGVHICIS